MQKAPVLKGSGLAPIDDEPVHVFGRNLEARVVEAHQDDDKKEEEEDKHEEEDVETIKKRKFDTITGEENEETVFQGEFKLFVWDVSTSNWIEKGRGQLKLNDDLNEQRSRLIMRISGTFRIILNVAIRHSLFKVISSTKTSIRFSDSQNVWAVSGSNAKQLGDLINDRIALAAKRAQESGEETNKSKDEANKPTTAEKDEEGKQAEEKQKEKAGDHSTRDDTTAPAEEDDKDGKKHSDKEDAEDSESSGSDEKDQEDTRNDERDETQNSDDKSSDHEPEEHAGTNTSEEDEDRHHSGGDESKRLKLSSD